MTSRTFFRGLILASHDRRILISVLIPFVPQIAFCAGSEFVTPRLPVEGPQT